MLHDNARPEATLGTRQKLVEGRGRWGNSAATTILSDVVRSKKRGESRDKTLFKNVIKNFALRWQEVINTVEIILFNKAYSMHIKKLFHYENG